MDKKNTFVEKMIAVKTSAKQTHLNILLREEYNNLVAEVSSTQSVYSKTSVQYRRLKRFNVLEINGNKKLISNTEGEILYYVPIDEAFDVIQTAHIATGHGERDRLIFETSKNYANITKYMINAYLELCENCYLKRSKRNRGLVSKPILHSELNSRCQVDLIDMQSQQDEDYRFIMVYQDHLTKFCILNALKTKTAEEVAYNLLNIFTTFGAPCILHSDNGREFVNKVIENLTCMWPEMKLVHGKPRHSQSQGSVERANQDIENMLATWMKDNSTTKWAQGLRFVQFMKNRALHSGIKMSPYKAMFGIEPRVGLKTKLTDNKIISEVSSEEDLEQIFGNETSDCSSDEITAIQNDIHDTRQIAAESLKNQAKRMKTTSDLTHPPAQIGDNVTLPIPEVDKAKGSLRNIMAVVLNVNNDNLYQLGTKEGILQCLYSRSQFDICKEKFILLDEVATDKKISLRNAAAISSGNSQGFTRCHCIKGCRTKLCLCKKNNKLCNSKCHNSSTCKNK